MKFSHQRRIALTSLLVMVAVMQTYVGVSFAARGTAADFGTVQPQQISGILTTAENKPVMVNGAEAMTGATIVSGALVETGKLSASISIPGHGTLDISPNTRLIFEIDQTGSIKVTLKEGCVTLHTLKGTTGEVVDPRGAVTRTNSAIADVISTCDGVKTAGVAAAGGGGIGTGGAIAIAAGVGAGITGIALALRGSNPSPATP